jgi:hypothetical protein
MKTLKALLAVAVLVVTPVFAGSPSIQFTYYPPPNTWNSWAFGDVSDVPNISQYCIALYINVFGTWWIKPNYNSTVSITPTSSSSGTFATVVTTGGYCDSYAEQIAAFVIPLTYTPPQLSGAGSLPAELTANSVASVIANTPQVDPPIWFSTNWWTVKDTGVNCAYGPSNNHFLDQTVWADSQGLHLQIAYVNGAWCCSEVMLTNSLGYGTYRVQLANDVSNMPPEVVFGFFTWDSAYSSYYKEIDVEFSNGSTIGWPNSWQYVVQPYTAVGQRIRFPEPANMETSTHSFTWIPGKVYFESYTNYVPDYKTFIIQTSTNFTSWLAVTNISVTNPTTTAFTLQTTSVNQQFYRAVLTTSSGNPTPPFMTGIITNGVPPEGGEAVHLNLWLNPSQTLSEGTTSQTYQTIVKKFEYIPIQPELKITGVIHTNIHLTLKYGS